MYEYHLAYSKNNVFDSLIIIQKKAEKIAEKMTDDEAWAKVNIMKGVFFTRKNLTRKSMFFFHKASELISNVQNPQLKVYINTHLANNYFILGYPQKNLDSCFLFHKESLKYIEDLNSKTIVDIYSRLSQAYIFANKIDSVKKYSSKILELANSENDNTYYGKYYESKFNLFRFIKNKDSTYYYMDKIYEVLINNKDHIDNFKDLLNIEFERMGSSYYLYNDYNNALIYLDSSINLSIELNDYLVFKRVFPIQSYILTIQGKNIKSLELNQKALDLGYRLGDSSLIAKALNSMTYVYDIMGDYAKGIEVNQKIIKEYLPYLSFIEISSIYTMQCNLYGQIDDNMNTVKYALQAYNYNPTIVSALNLGEALLVAYTDSSILKKDILPKEINYEALNTDFSEDKAKIKILELSKMYLEKALSFAEENNEYKSISSIYFGLGNYYDVINNSKKAMFYYDRAWTSSRKTKINAKNKIRLTNRLYELYKAKSNTSKALKWLELRDSLEKVEQSQNNLADLGKKQAEFEYSQELYEDSLNQKQKDLEVKHEQERQALKLKAEEEKKYYLYGGLFLLAIFLFILYRRFKVALKQKSLIELQKEAIEEKRLLLKKTHEGVQDSINYSKRIQKAVFPSMKSVKDLFHNSFFFFKPKDVVSGDFYWVCETKGKKVLVIADCTGHGVPGAFMTIIGINILKEIIQEGIVDSGVILKEINKRLIERLSQQGKSSVKDGMDLALCIIDGTTVEFVGAHLPLYHVREGELIEYKGSNIFLGSKLNMPEPKIHYIPYQSGDIIYMSTDGLPDQKGGEKGKKFYSKRLKDFLLANSGLSAQEQEQKLISLREEWLRGEYEQLDDMTVIGIKL